MCGAFTVVLQQLEEQVDSLNQVLKVGPKMDGYGCKGMRCMHTSWTHNPSNAEATFVQRTRMQTFLKTI